MEAAQALLWALSPNDPPDYLAAAVEALKKKGELRADLVGRGVEAAERTEVRTRPPAG